MLICLRFDYGINAMANNPDGRSALRPTLDMVLSGMPYGYYMIYGQGEWSHGSVGERQRQ